MEEARVLCLVESKELGIGLRPGEVGATLMEWVNRLEDGVVLGTGFLQEEGLGAWIGEGEFGGIE